MSTSLLSFKGTWNCVTNIPHLADGVGTAGDCYIILAQTTATHYNVYDNDLGSGAKSWIALHYIYYTGTTWELYERSSATATSGVTSVNGQTGVVVLDTDDIAEGSTNRYFTDTRVISALSPGTGILLSSGGTITNSAPDQVVVLNQGPGVIITGTYPTFSISSSGGTSVTPAALTTSGDTNLTLQATGTPASALLEAVKLTIGWQGTLADNRIASSSAWNAKQPQLNGTGFVKASGTTITYDNNTYLTSGVTSVAGTGGLYSSGTTAVSIALTDLGNAGTYGDNTHVPIITTDQKGRVVSISTTPIPLTSGVTSVSGAPGEVFASGTTAVTVGLPDKGTAGVYGGAAQIPIITIDTKGRVTSITTTSVYSSGVTSVVGATGEIFTSGTPVVHAGLVDVGVAGTYGDSTRVPIITTDSKGRIISVSSANVYSSGVTSVIGTAGLYSSGSPATSIGIADIGVAGTYGSGSSVPVITTNSRGQVTGVLEIPTSGVTSARIINTTSPLQGGGDLSADRTLSILQASSGATGALLAADWITFNNKLNNGTNSAASQVTLGSATPTANAIISVKNAVGPVGALISGNGSTNAVGLGSVGGGPYIQGYTAVAAGTANLILQPSGANVMIGTSTDGGEKLQVVGSVAFDLGSDSSGDTYVRASTGSLARVPIGSTGQVLTVVGGLPTWGTMTSPVSTYVISDFSTSGTTSQDITNLSFSVIASGIYQFDCMLSGQKATTNTGVRIGFSGPAGATCEIEVFGTTTANTTIISERLNTLADGAQVYWSQIGAPSFIRISGTVFIGANAGTVQIRIRTVSSNIVTVFKGSWLIAHKLN